MAEFQISPPLSEDEVKARFAEHGIDYQTRAERYRMLNNTPFGKVDPKYYIAYYPTVEDGARGVKFIGSVIAGGGQGWVSFEE